MEATDDSILYEDSFETMKVAELKVQLKARNLPTSGLRNELIARLREAVISSKDSVDDEEDEEEEEDDDDDVEGDGTSEIPSQVSLFTDSHFNEELQDEIQDEILDDPDLTAKEEQDSFDINSPASITVTKSSLNAPKVVRTPLKPLKRTTTTVPSNGTSSSAKKICLNRSMSASSAPSETVEKKSTHVPVTLSSDESSETKSTAVTKTLTPQEKLALRAKRFNLSSTDTNTVKVTDTNTVKVMGKSSYSWTRKSGINPISFEAPDIEKLKKRAERFGVVSTVLKKIEEKDKVKQRLERFSSSSASSTSSTVLLPKDEEAKLKSRMQRFGAT